MVGIYRTHLKVYHGQKNLKEHHRAATGIGL